MLTATSLEETRLVVERLRAAIRMLTFAPPSSQFHGTMSIGVAEMAPTQTLEELLREVEEALYAAKRTGRDRDVLATDLSSWPAPAEVGHAA